MFKNWAVAPALASSPARISKHPDQLALTSLGSRSRDLAARATSSALGGAMLRRLLIMAEASNARLAVAEASMLAYTEAVAIPPRALTPRLSCGMRCAVAVPVALAEGDTLSLRAGRRWGQSVGLM